MIRMGPFAKGCGWFAIILAIALLIPSGKSAAQAPLPADPLVLAMQGDIWTLKSDGSLRQLTTWGMNEWPIISPDGTRVAYSSFATIFANWMKTLKGGTGGYQPPENLWILDLPSSQTFRIADQPPGAHWNGINLPGKYVLRTLPSWSPDGQHLAWTEILLDTPHTTNDLNGSSAQLIVWDSASQISRMIASGLPGAYASELNLYVKWGRPGIALFVGSIPGMIHDPIDEEFRVYDVDGQVITQVAIRGTYTMWALEWIQAGSRDYLFDRWDPERETWLDWQTAQDVSSAGVPELYSLSAPNGASFTWLDGQLTLIFPGKAPINLGEDMQIFGISRDGQWAAYGPSEKGAYETTIEIRSADRTVRLGVYISVDQVVWGPVGWRARVRP